MPPNHVACYGGDSRQAAAQPPHRGAVGINIPDASNFLRAQFIIDQLKLPGPSANNTRDPGHQGSGVDYRPRNWAGKCHRANWHRAAGLRCRGCPAPCVSLPLRTVGDASRRFGHRGHNRGAPVSCAVVACRWQTNVRGARRHRASPSGWRGAPPWSGADRWFWPGAIRRRCSAGRSRLRVNQAVRRRGPQQRASYWLATHPFFNRFTWSYIRRRNVTRASGEGPPTQIPRTPRQTFVGLSMFRTCYTYVEYTFWRRGEHQSVRRRRWQFFRLGQRRGAAQPVARLRRCSSRLAGGVRGSGSRSVSGLHRAELDRYPAEESAREVGNGTGLLGRPDGT